MPRCSTAPFSVDVNESPAAVMCSSSSARRAAWWKRIERDVIAMAIRELAVFFPRVKEAKLRKRAHVVKEVHATFRPSRGWKNSGGQR